MSKLTSTTRTTEYVEHELQKLSETVDNYSNLITDYLKEMDFSKLNSGIEQLIYKKIEYEYTTKDKEIKELVDYVASPKFTCDVSAVLELAKILNNDDEYLREQRESRKHKD